MTQIGERIADLFGWGGPPEPGSLEVTVTERESDKPVAGVEVMLTGRTGGRAVTGADGVARFPALEPGPYWVAAKEDPEFEIRYGTGFAVVDDGETAELSLRVQRIILTIVVKRAHIKNLGQALKGNTAAVDYGHWWIEIDEEESYGWWPAHGVSTWDTLAGVPGRLNGLTGGGTETTDAHHGDPADEMFHPAVESGKTAAAVKACIRAFAKSYKGSWSWPWGQNCHSFQEEMMEHCELAMSSKKANP